MTIALGVIAGDGVVLAADTEETDGYLKTGQSKISTAIYQNPQERVYSHCACGISGAGTAGHIDLLTERLSEIFLDHAVPLDRNQRLALAAEVSQFYRDHVVPFASYPEHERPDFSMLLALSLGKHDRQILVSEKTALRPGKGFAAVGIGAMFARILLKELWHSGMSVKTAIWLAAYAIWQTKESIPSCGKFTEILVLSEGEASFVSWQDVQSMETAFRHLIDLDGLLFHYVTGSVATNEPLVKLADQLRGECGGLLTRLLPIHGHPMFVRPPAPKDGIRANNWRLEFQPKSRPLPEPKPSKPKRRAGRPVRQGPKRDQ